MNDELGFYVSKEDALEIALSVYVGDECPYCGKPMTRDDLDTAIVSDMPSRSPCHGQCWTAHVKHELGYKPA